ncbi:MAG TPA: GntR family transcriptional regulator [Propionicimonas sp.]|jgi:DNA-binding GntR family transcriptional regulator
MAGTAVEPGTMVRPHGSAAQGAYEYLHARIMSGDLAPGSMLSENDLARRIGVSRTPVRAALLRLQGEGWITVYPRQGALVREIGAQEAADIFGARLLLEVSGVRGLGSAGRSALAADLVPALAEQDDAARRGDIAGFVALDVRMHRRFVEGVRNALLFDLYDRLRQRQAFIVARSLASPGRTEAIVAEHRELVDLIAADDVDGFERLLDEHLRRTHEVWRSLAGRAGAPAQA